MTTAAQRAAYQYQYTEPHPSVVKPTHLSTGRGGAGNATRLCPQTATPGHTATGPASRSPIVSPSLATRRVSTGRGGAGNVKDKKNAQAPGEPTLYELEREARHNHEESITAEKRVWHYGRGGEGNLINQAKSKEGSIKSAKGKDKASFEQERRASNESVISSGSSVGSVNAERPAKGSRQSSFTEKIAAKLGARRPSNQGSLLAV